LLKADNTRYNEGKEGGKTWQITTASTAGLKERRYMRLRLDLVRKALRRGIRRRCRGGRNNYSIYLLLYAILEEDV